MTYYVYTLQPQGAPQLVATFTNERDAGDYSKVLQLRCDYVVRVLVSRGEILHAHVGLRKS